MPDAHLAALAIEHGLTRISHKISTAAAQAKATASGRARLRVPSSVPGAGIIFATTLIGVSVRVRVTAAFSYRETP